MPHTHVCIHEYMQISLSLHGLVGTEAVFYEMMQ